MHLSNTLTPHSLNRRQDPSAKTLQASSLILAAPPSATEATSHILSHTARPSINLPHRPPIHTLPNHLRIQRLRAVGTVHPSSYPRALQIGRKIVFVFRRLLIACVCVCASVSRMRLYRTTPSRPAFPPPSRHWHQHQHHHHHYHQASVAVRG